MVKKHAGMKDGNNKTGGYSIDRWVQIALLFVALVELVALPIMGFTLANFIKVFLLSLIPVFIVFLLASSAAEKQLEPKKKKVPGNTAYSTEPELFEPRPSSRNRGQKLVKLEKKNFNWSMEDVNRSYTEPKEPERVENFTRTDPAIDNLKKRYNPYRSPFEPIHPPVKQEQPKEAEPEKPQPVPVQTAANTGSEDLKFQSNEEEIIEREGCADEDSTGVLAEITYTQKQYDTDLYNDEIDIPGTSWDEVQENTAVASEFQEQQLSEQEPEESEEAFLHNEGNVSILHRDDKIVKLVFKPRLVETEPAIPALAKPAIREPANIEPREVVPYILPPVNLLKKDPPIEKGGNFDADVEFTANKLIETLASFGVGARVLDVSKGPSVTRYELQPNAGVKVSKIVGLADDIALNLAATGVRIEAPIPGKAAVGIEVPNKEVTAVLLRDVIETEEFQKHSSKLAFAVGKDVAGRTVVGDIAKMPHMLIAGATGSGKSVCINTLIASILYKASPREVKLLMVDPKVVELGIYNGIPHLLIPVVTDPKKAAGALNWAVVEMTTRYKLFAENNVRDLKGYNNLIQERGEEPLPQIVIIIDELADLMMVAPNDVEDCICRLAQMARAAGMHLVIATQRPSVDVITGVIKANIPSRISFAVSSQIDSRTILDMAGAEKLLGRGDMLYNPIGEPKPIRVQGGFISDKEVEAIVNEIKMTAQAEYDQEILDRINSQTEQQQQQQNDGSGDDELLTQAIEMVLEHGQASASLIQRKFKVGYSRAARILDQMESWGVVGPAEGSKPRQLLITRQEWIELNS